MVYKRDLVLEHVIARTRRENFSRLNNDRIQTKTSAIQGAMNLEYAYFLKSIDPSQNNVQDQFSNIADRKQ